MHTQSTLLPRAPLSHPTSPADTILQRPPKPNTANWEVMTARGLLDLIANFSTLASHSPSTGKMRLCTSFQKCTSFYFVPFPAFSTVHTHPHTHTPFLSWAVLKPKISWRLHYMCFPKSWPTTSRGNMFVLFFLLLGQGCKLQL